MMIPGDWQWFFLCWRPCGNSCFTYDGNDLKLSVRGNLEVESICEILWKRNRSKILDLSFEVLHPHMPHMLVIPATCRGTWRRRWQSQQPPRWTWSLRNRAKLWEEQRKRRQHFVILPTIAIKRLAIWGPLGKDDGCDDRCGARVKENVRLLVAGIKSCNY